MAERDTQAAILAHAGALPFVRLWRQQVGATPIGSGPAQRFVRYGLPGMADLSGLLRCGRRVEVEVKSETGRPSPEQERWADMVQAWGGLYVLARSVADVDRRLKQHLTECDTCLHAQPWRPVRA